MGKRQKQLSHNEVEQKVKESMFKLSTELCYHLHQKQLMPDAIAVSFPL